MQPIVLFIHIRREVLKSLSLVQHFVTPWTVAHQAPPSMEFSRQKYWSGLPFPSPRHLPNPGFEPGSPTLWADALSSEPPGNNQCEYFRYSPETITTLLIGYTPIQNK